MARPGGPRSEGSGPNPVTVPRARLDSLTGLRFFAALVVLGFHYDRLFFWRSPALRTAPKVFVQGGVGVSFFFILSGFVLAWSHRHGDTARSFLRRRLARIGPLHVGTWAWMIVITLLLGGWPGVPQAALSLSLLAPWSWWWSSHLTLNVPSWSLGCELFFYGLFPGLFAALTRARPGQRRLIGLSCVAGAVVAAALVNAAHLGAHVSVWIVYFLPPVRLLEFVLGMVLALEVAEGRLPRISLILATVVSAVAYLAAAQAPAAFQPVAVTIVPFALLVVAAAQADSSGRASVFRFRPLVTLGVWSFALYLAHWPVLGLISYPIHGTLDAGETALLGLGCLVVAVAVSGVLHGLVERPLESRLRGERPRAEVEDQPAAVLHPSAEPVRP